MALQPEWHYRGDVNDDGIITIADALEIIKYLAGLPNVISASWLAEDAALITPASRAVGRTHIRDALEIMSFLAGLESIVTCSGIPHTPREAVTPPHDGRGALVELLAREAVDWSTAVDGNGPWRSQRVLINGDGEYTVTLATPGGFTSIAQFGLYSQGAELEPNPLHWMSMIKPFHDWADATVTFTGITVNGNAIGLETAELDTDFDEIYLIEREEISPNKGFVFISLWNGWSQPHRRLTGVTVVETDGESVSFSLPDSGEINSITVTFEVKGTGREKAEWW